ncbi:hypothetical protein [Adhaeretor mobilis]|uniref:Uncharacterized protein n=1 Tax=Adhaeretor mobilis TaxID=1930276 RepID=A0A517N2U1_9BACT|nr:hypothetical protein [Adhaeretor mobilis]QDT01447.1 hypothetical protein HG15A2_47890 [Adhaeretor mobilis]
MADKFDPYREALVMETETEWPDAYLERDEAELTKLAIALHATAEEASEIQYVRMHTGFCRKIVATEEDIERVSS